MLRDVIIWIRGLAAKFGFRGALAFLEIVIIGLTCFVAWLAYEALTSQNELILGQNWLITHQNDLIEKQNELVALEIEISRETQMRDTKRLLLSEFTPRFVSHKKDVAFRRNVKGASQERESDFVDLGAGLPNIDNSKFEAEPTDESWNDEEKTVFPEGSFWFYFSVVNTGTSHLRRAGHDKKAIFRCDDGSVWSDGDWRSTQSRSFRRKAKGGVSARPTFMGDFIVDPNETRVVEEVLTLSSEFFDKLKKGSEYLVVFQVYLFVPTQYFFLEELNRAKVKQVFSDIGFHHMQFDHPIPITGSVNIARKYIWNGERFANVPLANSC